MRKLLLIGTIIFVLIGGSAAAVENFGLGAVVGEPTGITGKMFLSDNSAVDATLSWSFVKDKLYVHSDYLHHIPGVFGPDVPELLVYTGIGGMIELKEDPEIGVRIPLGLSYTIPDTPLELFFELAPVVLLAPETTVDLTGGLGARYYF
ncbi:MAG: hypothetical protein ACOC7X_00135 [Spirochaetota bacterium]